MGEARECGSLFGTIGVYVLGLNPKPANPRQVGEALEYGSWSREMATCPARSCFSASGPDCRFREGLECLRSCSRLLFQLLWYRHSRRIDSSRHCGNLVSFATVRPGSARVHAGCWRDEKCLTSVLWNPASPRVGIFS